MPNVITMENRNLKYIDLYNEVRKISNAHDLMGLIKIGSPDDEYDPETSKILPLLVKSNNSQELATEIANIYNEMFDTDFKPSDKCITNIAEDLFKLKEE